MLGNHVCLTGIGDFQGLTAAGQGGQSLWTAGSPCNCFQALCLECELLSSKSGSAVLEKCLNFSRLHLFIHYKDYDNTHLFLNILVMTKNAAC